jgi:hypothetical protein
MKRWTPKQVADAASDEASLSAARKLAVPGPWSETGSNDTLVWGKCQGSGKAPYQVSVDLSRPAYRCSCPSRKFPCKHTLALLMLWSEYGDAIPDVAEPAGFASEWAEKGQAARTRSAARPKKPPDAADQAKRLESRILLMTSGMEEFSLWLADLVRAGTAAARQQPPTWWDATAARLVDAQLPGLADQVRTMGSAVHSREDWSDHLLSVVGLWWTATRAWAIRDRLDDATMGDLRAYLGWNWATDDIRALGAIQDTWLVLGAHRGDDGRLQQQRTWLWGESCREAVQVLDFAPRGASLPVAQVVGSRLDASVAHYPGHASRRVVVVGDLTALEEPGATLPDAGSIEDGLAAGAAALAANPWTPRHPVVLRSARFTPTHVVDDQDEGLALAADADPWRALALTGGHPACVFGEVEEACFRPLSAELGDRVVQL